MSQPLQRLKAFSPSRRSSGAAPEVNQAPKIRPPQQPARDRGTAGHADPVLEARNGAAVDATKRPLRLLVVAQDSTMCRQMIDYLESHDMRATSAAIRPEILHHLAASEPDLIVLDTRLCQSNGIDLLCDVRSASAVPLIVVGRQQLDEADRVIALELGADDYITHPFGLRELVARIRAVLRGGEARRRTPSDQRRQRRCRFAGWQFDRRTLCLTSPAGVPVALTNGECALLMAFLDAPLQPLTRENLLQATRVHEDVFDRSIDVCVFRLRRKLETDATAPRLIQSARGTGYMLAAAVEQL
jgi:two-component system, OmpR family, response regulator